MVSGGSGGIGSAVVRGLRRRGWYVVIGYATAAQKAATLAADNQGEALALDLRDDGAIARAVAHLAKLAAPVSAIVLAGSPAPSIAPFTQFDAAHAIEQWRINVLGPRHLLAGMIKSCFRPRRRGAVIAVLSRAMGEGEADLFPQMADYVIAKYGLAALIKAAAAEYPWLRTEAIYPGFVDTPMLAAFDARTLDVMKALLPERRFATPDEIAEDICNLVGEPIDS